MDLDPSSEQELVDRALNRSNEHVRALLDYLAPTIQAVLVRYLPAWNARNGITELSQGRDELFQEVVMELLVKKPAALSRFDSGVARLKTFVYTIASRTCYTIVSRKPLIRTEDEPDEVPDPGPSIEHRTMDRDFLERVYETLSASLTPDEALIFELAVVQGLDAKEISEKTAFTPSQIHMRKHRVLRKAQAIAVELMAKEDDE